MLALLPVMALHAQAPDPLASPECSAARAQLEQALSDPAAGHSRPGDRIAVAREKAASACLGGGNEGKRERSGAPQPAQVVPPPKTGLPPARAPALPEVALPRQPAEVPRPTIITTCDPAGCWDSQGRRLNNMGPTLMGPRGLCSLQAGVVVCP